VKDLLVPTYLNTAAQKAGVAAGSAIKTLREPQSMAREIAPPRRVDEYCHTWLGGTDSPEE